MWFKLYEKFEEASVSTDYDLAKSYLDTLYGETEVAEIYLRKSKPIDSSKAKVLQSPLCEKISEIKNGFAIYLTLEPSSKMFLGQLAHEVAHLKNAQATDLYIEGINTNFGRKLHSHLGREAEWSEWEAHFESGKDNLYADTYFLIKELEAEIGHDFICKAFDYLIPIKKGDGDTSKYVIDLGEWLNELDSEVRAKAVEIFKRHQEKVLLHKSGDYAETQMIDGI